MRLEPATSAEAVARDRLSHAAWEPDLGEERFVAREAMLRAGPWPRAALVPWLWRDDERALASCETYRVRSTWQGRPGTSFAIASVYTEPALRGRGHASRMIEALAAWAARDPDAQALVLFSDVAPAIYERLGFVARPAFDRVVREGVAGATLFGETELAAIHRDRPLDGFGIWPSLDQLDWHLDRARTRAQGARPARCGARWGDDHAVWVDDGDRLLVLLVTGSHEVLLGAAAAYAEAIGLREVRAWETPGWPEGCGRREPRTGALPMLRPLSPAVDARAWAFVPRALWV